MQLNLDDIDKKLLMNKLVQVYQNTINNASYQIDQFFEQFITIFQEFDLQIKPTNKIEDILLIQIDDVNTAILSSAVIREIRNNYPQATINLVVNEDYSQLFEKNPYTDAIIPINTNKAASFKSMAQFCLENLWDRQYDLAINLHWDYVTHAAMLNFLSLSLQRVSYRSDVSEKYCMDLQYDVNKFQSRRTFDKFFYTKLIDNPYDLIRDKERLLWILSMMDLKIDKTNTEVWFDDDDVNYVQQFLKKDKKNIIVGVGGNFNGRYPFDDLAKALIELDPNAHYILASTFVDSDFSITSLTKALEKTNTVVNTIGRINFTQLCALINQADLYVGNVLGLVQIADTLDKPMIVLHREAEEKEYFHPHYFSYYHRFLPQGDKKKIILRPKRCLDDCILMPVIGGCSASYSHCIKGIKPDDIVKAYRQLESENFI